MYAMCQYVCDEINETSIPLQYEKTPSRARSDQVHTLHIYAMLD